MAIMSIASCGLGREKLRALHSVKDAQEILSVSHATVYRLIKDGDLDARKIGNKTLITDASIQTLIASLPRVGEADHARV